MSINLNLEVNEVNAILQTLGKLPTETGAYPLMIKIKEQAEAQLPKPDDVKSE